jgi:DNA processing protein
MTACDDCLRRTALIAGLAGRLDIEWRRRDAPGQVLALTDAELLALGDAATREAWARFSAGAARDRVAEAGLVAVCRCAHEYPAALEDLPDPPAVIHVAGRPDALADADRVGIVGARAATGYGLEVARELGRTLTLVGVPVVSGLALGVDAAAHAGAILATAAPPAAPLASAPTAPTAPLAPPVAVLAGGADRPYPARGRRLHDRVRAAGAVVSEMPPGFGVHRWAFVARNRIIAALCRVLVVVEAAERSGSLTTADFAAGIGRTVAAVPGRVTARTAAGTNGLIRDGAPLVRHAADVLDLLADVTGAAYPPPASAPPRPPGLDPALHALLDRIEDGCGTLAELASTSRAGQPFDPREVLIGLGRLEAAGLVQRAFGGRYERAL